MRKALSKKQYGLLAAVAGVLSYLFFLLATDTGSILQWGFTLASLYLAVDWLIKAIRTPSK